MVVPVSRESKGLTDPMFDQNGILHLAQCHQRELIEQAEHERLIALATQRDGHASSLRHDLAAACYRLAEWLDTRDRYQSPVESVLAS
jgi:hypothetical protein